MLLHFDATLLPGYPPPPPQKTRDPGSKVPLRCRTQLQQSIDTFKFVVVNALVSAALL